MAKTHAIIKFDGPFFAKDPSKTFIQNVRVMLDAAAAEGEGHVKARMREGQSSRAPLGMGMGRVSDHVVGRVESLAGKPWMYWAVVSVQNKGFEPRQAVKLMAAASWLESTIHPFRRLTTAMRASRAVNKAELLKGIK